MKNKVTAYHLCVIAFCVVINIVGGQIALFARLPIYLDSIGTVAGCSNVWSGIRHAAEFVKWVDHGDDQ